MNKLASTLKLTHVFSLFSYHWMLPITLAIFLILVSYENYLLFHVLAEFFTIIVAVLVTVVVWNTYNISHNHYLMYLGCGYFWVAILDFIHTMVYKGMAIYPILEANPATQFWISARYFESLLLLSAPLFINRSINRYIATILFGMVALSLYLLIMEGNFPDAFIEGHGLTRFKVISEYIIIAILLASLFYLWRQRQYIDQYIINFITASILFSIIAELAFTFYVSVYGISNLVGHIFKLFSFWLIFQAVVLTTLKKPIKVINQKLLNEIKQHKDAQDKYSLLLNSTAEAIYGIDMKGECTFVNPACLRILGYNNEEEVIGKNMHDLIHHSKQDGIVYPLKECKIFQAFHMKKGTHVDDEVLWRKDGSSFPAEYWSYPISQNGTNLGAVVTFFDITKQKQLEMEREQNHQLLEQKNNSLKNSEIALEESNYNLQQYLDAIDKINIGLFVVDNDYRIRYMNNTMINWFGNQTDKICYSSVAKLDKACPYCKLKEVIVENKKVIYEPETPDGQSFDIVATSIRNSDGTISKMEVIRNVTDSKNAQKYLLQQKEKLAYLAHHDSLTGLPNRLLFNDRLEKSIEKSKRYKTKTALLFIDLDHFKEINDSLGHNIGDEVLKTITRRLDNTIRKEDTLARFGGDEFTIILEDLTQGQNASFLAQKIINSLAKILIIENNRLYITTSIGISLYPDDGINSQDLLKYADSAMYKAKSEGRNNFQFYSAEMTALAFERVVMESSFREALKNEDFLVYYQPQINAKENKLIGMEALVRWQHTTMGLISPAKFIPLAETTGLIIELDQFVMKTAMKQISLWYNKGLNPGVLALNLAIKQLQQRDFISILGNLLKETQCKPQWIELEVTEGQIMTNPEEAIKILKQISDMGIELAVDDFGTGYSSLSYLKKLPLNKLKIDQSFVRELPDDEEDSTITKSVIALAQSLNLKIIAEGVETKEQEEFLVSNGCDNIQGYYFSRPIPTDEMEEYLKK